MSRVCSLLAVVLLLTSYSRAQGQGLVIAEEVEDVAGADLQQQQQFMVGDDYFDQVVYGRPNGSADFKTRMDTLLSLRVDEIHQACNITDVQRRRLMLAGQGDVKRFSDRVTEVRARFKQSQFDQQKFNEFWQEVQPIQMKMQSGLLGPDSFFHKSILQVLNPEQRVVYLRLDQQRKNFRYRARVELMIATIENSCPFTDEQREKLIEIILAETQPPRSFGQYDTYTVMYKMSKIDEAKLKTIFDETQWKAFSMHIGQGRGMEQFLRQNGMLDDVPASNAVLPPAEVPPVDVQPAVLTAQEQNE